MSDCVSMSVSVDYQHCAQLLCQATVEAIVRERFGSKCLRIFRLLLLKKILEQKQVVDMAMIPGKEARELLYSLLAENFVTLQVHVYTCTCMREAQGGVVGLCTVLTVTQCLGTCRAKLCVCCV